MLKFDINTIKEKLIRLNILSYDETFYLAEFILNQKLSETDLFSVFNAYNARKTISKDFLTCVELRAYIDYFTTKLNTNLEIINTVVSTVSPTYYSYISTRKTPFNVDLFVNLIIAAYFNFKQDISKLAIYDKKTDRNLCGVDKVESIESINYTNFFISKTNLSIVSDLEAMRVAYSGESIIDLILGIFKQHKESYPITKFFVIKDSFIKDYFKDLQKSNTILLESKENIFEIATTSKISKYSNFDWVETPLVTSTPIINSDFLSNVDYDSLIFKSLTKDALSDASVETYTRFIFENAAYCLAEIFGLDQIDVYTEIRDSMFFDNKIKEYIETGEIIPPIIP